MQLHDDQLPIDEALVRSLIDTQFPHYSGLPLRQLDLSGSTNTLFRLGDDLVVRLPLQPGAGAAIASERHWSDTFRTRLPVALPETVAIGSPGSGYPETWAILRWLPGDRPGAYESGDPPDPVRSRLAADLAAVITALRDTPLTEQAVHDPRLRGYRGRSLAEFDPSVRSYLADCRANEEIDLDLDHAQRVWEQSLELPGSGHPGPHPVAADRWYHGDLVAENLLVGDGRLSAVVDFAVSVGDPTVDLHGAWELFDPPAREVFRQRLQVDDAAWLRGRAWALGIALGTFSYYWHSLPARRRDRLAMIRNVLDNAS
ncbi:phosphotransferase [Microlunatus endophyticus]|uniref:Phosphotransferase n=1 Tax=Microlunatus endophyticus TaxID=1716077 RepID=A0A917S4D2_9ACTN|nr:phosphotransferase [Microlunatus endophyticus]GGL57712.1 phosphotransferase [Microlunatus endophyticus]